MLKALFTFISGLIFLGISLPCFAGIETSGKKLDGPFTIGTSTLTVKDDKFQNPNFTWTDITNRTVKNMVSLRVNDDVYISYKFTYRVTLSIDVYKDPISSLPDHSEPAVLTVTYDPTLGPGAVIKSIDTYNINDPGYKMVATVVGLQAVEGVAPTNNMVTLEGSVMVDRTVKFSDDVITPVSAPIVNNKLDLSNIFAKSAEEYDVEWTTVENGNDYFTDVDNYLKGTNADPTASLRSIFVNNSSRITITNNVCTVPVIANDGYLLVRVRQAQYLDGVRLTGSWNYNVTMPGGASKFAVWATVWNEPLLNWQYSDAFAEEGKRKEVMTYFDGTLRGRQTVTINTSDNIPVAQENIYDQLGRVTASILPAPYTDGVPTIKYKKNFNISAVTNKPYTFASLSTIGSNCEISPEPLSTISGASRYYSAQNDFLALPSTDPLYRSFNKFIPDGQQYPISVSQYTNDNTGRVRLQGGVGPAFQPGKAAPGDNSNTTKYYYGKPDQWELDRLFGNDVGYAEHYQKNMVVDPNGQVSISYLNASGKTIATALSGALPASLDKLPSYQEDDPNAPLTVVKILKPEQFVFNSSEQKITATTTYLAPAIGKGSLSFDIQKLIDLYPGGAQQICSNCYYNMTIRIFDDCNNLVKSTSAPVQIGSPTSNCTDNVKYTGTLDDIDFKPGEYFVTVDFAFDSKVIDAYVDNFEDKAKQNGFLQQQFNFIKTNYLDNLDISGCYADCHTCTTMLGDRAVFIQMLTDKCLALDLDPASLASTLFTGWADAMYTTLKQKCDNMQLTCDYSPCTDVQNQMLADVSPGGQYALFKSDFTPLEPAINVITKTVNGIPNYRQSDKFPVLANTDNTYQLDLVTREDGSVTSPYDASFTVMDFIRYWKPEWANKFLEDHPEECKLEFCGITTASKNWDLLAADITNTADLGKLQTVASLPAPAYNAQTNAEDWLLNHDPFFAQAEGAPYKTVMLNDLQNYSKNVLSVPLKDASGNTIVIKGLLKYVEYLLYSYDYTNTNTPANNANNWNNSLLPSEDCRVSNREWQTYIRLYQGLKQKYLDNAQKKYCGDHSTACPIGEPSTYTLPGQCPTKNDFSILDDPEPPASIPAGKKSVVVSYNSGALSVPVSLTVYTPSGVISDGLSYAVNDRFKKIFVDDFLSANSLGISTVNCSGDQSHNGGNRIQVLNGGYSSSPCDFGATSVKLVDQYGNAVLAATSITVKLNFGTTIIGYDSNNQPIEAQTGFDYRDFVIPAGQSLSDEYTYPINFESPCGNERTFFACAGSITGGGDGITFESGLAMCAPAPPDPGICPSYAGKVSRFPTYTAPLLSGYTVDQANLLGSPTGSSISPVKVQAAEICANNADSWIEILRPGMQALYTDPATYAAKKDALKVRLIAVCSAGADEYHPFGASALKSGTVTTGDLSFENIIMAVVPQAGNKFSPAINPWLIESPIPADTKQQAAPRTVTQTSPDICGLLSTAKAEAVAAGLPLYDYLVATYKDAMTLTSAQLDVLVKSCTQCRFITTEDITLPVFLDWPFKGYITKSEYDGSKTDLLNKFQSAAVLQADANYPLILATYMNQKYGFVLAYDDYAAFEAASQINPLLRLCNKTPFKAVAPDPAACAKTMLEIAVNSGKKDYEIYIAEARAKFRADYINTCKLASANASLSTKQSIYHYTLYYYDQNDNLVRTIPPEGVHPITDPNKLAWVNDARVTNPDDGIAALDAYRSSIIENGKTAALNQLSAYLASTSSPHAIEMWTYNPNNTVNQFIEETPDKQFLFRVSIGSGRLNVDIYKTTETVANGQAGVTFTLSKNFGADISSFTPLNPWSHVVIQSTNFMAGSLNVYLNGQRLTAYAGILPSSGSWMIAPNGATINYPDNISTLKHLRFYTRFLSDAEIAANAANAVFVPASGTGMTWYRFNKPAAGGPTTISPTSTDETRITTVFPDHTLATNYIYNGSNQVLTQQSPDGGTSNYWYDLLARITASQNAKQQVTNDYSYTLYDILGRTAEVGEKINSGAALGPADYLTDVAKSNFLNLGTNRQVTRTLYDVQASIAASNMGNNSGVISLPEQSNLRKRVAATTYSDIGTGPALRATYYNYDLDGNVKTLWQQIDGLTDGGTADNLKRLDYEYDLISGKTNFVSYQPGNNDQFYYTYDYDAENRVIAAYSGTRALLNSTTGSRIFPGNKRMDASYRYYLHGPLSRTELGDNRGKVQGMDYAYTLQGWLKGVNSGAVLAARDQGGDGNTGSKIPQDAFGYSLNYYGTQSNPDYVPITPASNPFENATLASFKPLYNGNIAASSMNLPKLADPWHFYAYRYDQLNRLTNTDVFKATAGGTGLSSLGAVNDYHEDFSYDANGNINKVNRNGTGGLLMDQFEYLYDKDANGNIVNNRLRSIKDNAPDANFTDDVDNQQANNYVYDAIGNLKVDTKAGITATSGNDGILWNVYGKILSIPGANPVSYAYDASANRISKILPNNKITWYVRDAQGNTMAVYDNIPGSGEVAGINWREQQLYGSSRLGIWNPKVNNITSLSIDVAQQAVQSTWDSKGTRQFELDNHLGNVMATITDKRIQHSSDNTTTDYFMPDVVAEQEYYAFGALMPGRSVNTAGYRYGFNGKENDNEVKGEGNQQDYGMRIYDPRLGRFLSVDPIAKEYPELTPYQFASNSPIAHVDLDGLEKVIYLINMQTNTTTKLELQKAGRLGSGVAAQVIKKNGEIHGYYGTDAASALGFIKQYEKNGVDGHPFERYDDKYGNATIGYGHKLEADGKKLYPVGAKITPDQADKLLNTDYKSKSDLVSRNLKSSGLNKNQLEALIDFAFNVRKAESRVASFTTASGSTYFLEFMKGGPDLESRRVGESLMYDYGKYFKFDGLTKKQTDYLNKLVTDITSPSPPPSAPKTSSSDKPKPQ